MPTYQSSVSPKGQITLPVEFRRRLHLRAKDKVSIQWNDDSLVIRPAGDRSFLALYRSIPALSRPLTDNEMTEIAAEEHAQKAARDGL
jgi:AbrB family looped-hinge helix DNA binding protein